MLIAITDIFTVISSSTDDGLRLSMSRTHMSLSSSTCPQSIMTYSIRNGLLEPRDKIIERARRPYGFIWHRNVFVLIDFGAIRN